MPISSSELVLYWSANAPTNDSGASGGGVDTLRFPDFTQLAANDSLEAVSTSSSDTMNLTITARDTAGAIVSETKALNGTTVVSFSGLGTVERVLKAELASTPAGTVTIRRSNNGPTVRQIPAGKRGFQLAFYDSASDPSVQKKRYEKVFFRNESTLTLNAAQVTLIADPSAVIRITVDSAVNGTWQVANRLADPRGSGSGSGQPTEPWTDDGSAINVPGGVLAGSAAIGVWVEQTLAAGASPLRSTFTLQLSGTSV